MESFCPADPIYGNPLLHVSFFVQEFGYNVRVRCTVETKTTTSFIITPGGRVQFPNSFTESCISRAAEVRYPCKILTRKMYSSTHAGNMPTSCVYTRFYCIKYSSINSVTSVTQSKYVVLMAHYEKLLIQIINMAHICENDTIQIKDMFQIVATWLQSSTEEYHL